MMASGSARIPVDNVYTYEEDEDDDARTYTSGRTVATLSTMYRHENGRTYHAYRDGEYWQPNDAKQNNHEAIVHHLYLLTLQDRLYLAPIGSNPQRILDVGTGTGIWATDMADKFPSAQITGTDLSPTAPTALQPSNITFELDDCCSEWLYPPAHFSLIHIRGLFGSIASWPTLYRQILAHLKPGAWFEQLETSVHCRNPDGSITTNPVLRRLGDNAVKVGKGTGKTFEIAETMAGLVREAGFEGVVEKRFKWPVGPWSSDARLKEIGRWNLLSWEEGVEGWMLAGYTRVLGYSYAEVQEELRQIRATLRDRKTHAYHEVRLVYARKPE